MGVKRRSAAIAVAASGTLLGCSLFTDLGSLSDTPAPDPGVADAAAGVADASPSSTSDGASGTVDDAAARTDAAPSTVIFADDFENGAPLPRSWGATSGKPTLVQRAGAPSGTTVLRLASSAAAPSEAKLLKSLDVPAGAKKLSCAFSILVTAYGGGGAVHAATLETATLGTWFSYADAVWSYYARQDGTPNEFFYQPQLAMRDVWRRVTYSIETSGKLSFAVDGFVRTEQASPLTFSNSSLAIGIVDPYPDADIEVFFDDVACTAE